jgi:hypothetical protein
VTLAFNEPGQTGIRVQSALAQYTYATEDAYRKALEELRREGVRKRRQYYGGDQWDDDNAACVRDLNAADIRAGEKSLARWIADGRLPEHLRRLAYSTEIEDSVDYLTYRLCSDFAFKAKAPNVQDVLKRCLDASPELSGTAKDDELSVVNVTREALLAQDCPVRVRFDPAAGSCWLEFWPSDAVRMDFTRERSDIPSFVALWETYWMADPSSEGGQKQVSIRREWKVDTYVYNGPDGTPGEGPATVQCVETWWEERPGDRDLLRFTLPTGVPFVPWGLLRGSRKHLRTERGESVISNRAMALADRYDAVEQHSWLAARHNSHSTVGVIGDAALMRQNASETIHKDVADAVVFPGGTELIALSLPTDPSMIEHQRSVILDALFGCFGLARVDHTTLEGLGAVTGYALEILNTRTDSTFDALRTQFVRDWLALFNLILDGYAHWTANDTTQDLEGDYGAGITRALKIDPLLVYPNRDVEIRTGSGGVVDAAAIREDYASGLISRKEALRRMGYTDEEIKSIIDELDEETKAKNEAEAILTGRGIENGAFAGAPAPALGVVGGTTRPPATGTVGGTTNLDRNTR